MVLDNVEQVARIAGAVIVALAWIEAGRGMASSADRSPGPASALAARIGVLPAYLVVAVPYFALCALLWRPLPIEPSTAARIAALAVGAPVGLAGATLYLWGRWTLGPMYNVTGTLGAQLYDGHRLVVAGPYRRLRHPMYAGIVLGAVGGLLVYRTWTLVFVVAALPGVVLRARSEERLLAAAIGDAFDDYRRAVPAWIPEIRVRTEARMVEPDSPPRPMSPVRRLRSLLAPNSTVAGRLVRGLVVAPAAGWVVWATSWPLGLKVAAAVVMVLSVVSAVTGHCFLYDVSRLVRPHRPQPH